MKKILFIALLFCINQIKAQYVTIPDAKFVAYLQNIIPTAMSGDQMDTASNAVITLNSINVENDSIGDLTGVQYFDNLQILDCGNGQTTTPNFLTSLPKLPSNLDTLICGYNKLTNLPTLPNTLTLLKCYNNLLIALPALPSSLQYLDCDFNSLTSLPTLPNTLTYLHCYYNNLISLPALPNSLITLDCTDNPIHNLPTLPNSLRYLICHNDSLSNLPSIPSSLIELNCSSNFLTSLPTLPNTLELLNFGMNQITNMSVLPNSLTDLECENNQLTNLPILPTSLLSLYCSQNPLNNLPALPNSLSILDCSSNQLTSLPALPDSLKELVCIYNSLTTLPTLPNALIQLDCVYNQIVCFPTFPNTLVSNPMFAIYGNSFTCLPNYVPAMDAATLAYPLCTAGNANGCPNAQGIFGFTYKDINSNCQRNLGDTNLKNIPIQLYDNNNNLLGQTYTALNGVYDFPQTNGTYTIVIDTINPIPFNAQCNNLGLDTILTVATIDTNVNFSLICKSGFDVGVQSAVNYGKVFPGQQHTLYIIAGDLSQWYNLNCAAGISGQVQITVSGPVTYVAPAAGALTPGVAGNVFTYSIADFGIVNIMTAFNLVLSTNTNAHASDTICVNINVTPTAGDNNPSNNNYSFCYQVINSHDPNFKETYPVDVAPAFNNWLTYTIHFQNTGSASAINIRIEDTLDANLDLKTFQLINYSHPNTTQLNGNLLAFNFNNINLPDSTSNSSGSSGFVQYRVKPKANLPAGTQIKNTAYIYFDYNAAIITDTTINTFVTALGINQFSNTNSIKIYPNPAQNKITIDATDIIDVKLFDVLGKQITSTKQNEIDVANLPEGIYFIQVKTSSTTTTQKIIVQH